MTKLSEKFERVMTAAAFAEEGEFNTAREILREGAKRQDVRKETERQRPRLNARQK